MSFSWAAATILALLLPIALRADSESALKPSALGERTVGVLAPAPAEVGGGGFRTVAVNGSARVPVVVVRGDPYQMGFHLGELMRPEIQAFIPKAVAGFRGRLGLTDEQLDWVWSTTAAYTDNRFQQELLGLSAGSGVPLRTLQQAHCLPLLMPYSCSSIAAWGRATADGHLYQTRDLDWDLSAGAHNFPVVVIYVPSRGHAHALPTFAGIIGANCGMNAAGIVLSEMGDSPQREAPYNLRAPHFTSWFRTVLYDANNLSDALRIFQQTPPTKQYHFVFGDGRTEHRAVKILAHNPGLRPGPVRVWRDGDGADELAPDVLACVVYQDEGRGAFPALRREYGKLDGGALMRLADQIPIKGHNVLDAVFDATALRLWVSYARGTEEAYLRPYVFVDFRKLITSDTSRGPRVSLDP